MRSVAGWPDGCLQHVATRFLLRNRIKQPSSDNMTDEHAESSWH
jgi:hypothetical protein